MKKYIVTLIFLAALAGCINKDRIQIPVDVKAVIDSSGGNRTDLMVTISNFMHQPDPDKLEACYFLIANMSEKYFSTYLLYDSTNSIVVFNLSDYQEYQDLISGLDSIKEEHGEIHFKNHYIGYDYYKTSSEYLIKNIDQAFYCREKYPWSKAIPIDYFIKYVVPYRNTNEELIDWRQDLTERYSWIADSMGNSDDLVKAALFIKKDLNQWFKLDPRYYFNPTDQGIANMLTDSLGREEDMATLFTYACRAVGIPVAMDFTPYWPEDTSNSAWNVVFDTSGLSIPINAFKKDCDTFYLPKSPAKVYRMVYENQAGSLFYEESDKGNIPPFLHYNNLIDVTANYNQVSDIQISLFEPAKKSDFLFLCVWNNNTWSPIAWSKIKDNSALFKNMGRGIRYLPAFYKNDTVIPAANQLILHTSGSIEILDAHEVKKNELIKINGSNFSFIKSLHRPLD